MIGKIIVLIMGLVFGFIVGTLIGSELINLILEKVFG